MKPIGKGSIRKYTQGKCYRFAMALWIEHGKTGRIAIFTKEGSPYAHAYYELRRGVYIDVFGVSKGTRATARDCGFKDVCFVDGATYWKQVGRKPEWRDDIRKAKWLIRRNRERYLVTR
jgi:hypothetical protein